MLHRRIKKYFFKLILSRQTVSAVCRNINKNKQSHSDKVDLQEGAGAGNVSRLCAGRTMITRGALCRSTSPNFNFPNINVLNINVLHINFEWLKFRAHLLYQKLCRSTALKTSKKNFFWGKRHSKQSNFTLRSLPTPRLLYLLI
jgi:hypothetical protein